MQVTTAQKTRVFLFFIFGIGIFIAGAVGYFISRSEKRVCYVTKFENTSVAGLTEGSEVKFQGMNVGNVSEITVDKENATVIQVKICLKPDFAVKESMKTQLSTLSLITGLKFVELKGGGTGKLLPEGSEIPSELGFLDEITGKSSVIAAKLESILNKLNQTLDGVQKEDVERVIKNVEGISASLDEILLKNRDKITKIVASADLFLKELNGNMANVNAITTNIREITSKESSLVKTLATIEETITDFQADYKKADIQDKIDKMFDLVQSTQGVVDKIQLTFERNSEKIDKSLYELSEGMTNFSEFTRIIMENPSALFGSSSVNEDKE